MEKFIQLGEKLGLEGAELLAFIEKRVEEEREEERREEQRETPQQAHARLVTTLGLPSLLYKHTTSA